MKILSAEFVQSAASPRQFPPPLLPEVAFAGKSNVGKSSLINSLLRRKGLVKTSAAPGKTQLINFFRINDAFQLIDLPGYGFARVPLSVRAGWEALIAAYLFQRPVLRGVVMIVDARHEPGPLDLRMKTLLDESGLAFLVVANKVDKLGRAARAAQLQVVRQALGLSEPPLAYSATSHEGRLPLWEALGRWLKPAPPPEAPRASSSEPEPR